MALQRSVCILPNSAEYDWFCSRGCQLKKTLQKRSVCTEWSAHWSVSLLEKHSPNCKPALSRPYRRRELSFDLGCPVRACRDTSMEPPQGQQHALPRCKKCAILFARYRQEMPCEEGS